MSAARARRSAQSRAGIVIRTRKGQTIFPETSPQNSVAFGASNQANGASGTLLGAPGAGKTWIITSLVVSSDITPSYAGQPLQVSLTGNLGALFNAGNAQPQTLVGGGVPFSVGDNTSFGFSSSAPSSTCHFSISGTAYKATVGTVANAAPGQVIATAIDSDPAADLG